MKCTIESPDAASKTEMPCHPDSKIIREGVTAVYVGIESVLPILSGNGSSLRMIRPEFVSTIRPVEKPEVVNSKLPSALNSAAMMSVDENLTCSFHVLEPAEKGKGGGGMMMGMGMLYGG